MPSSPRCSSVDGLVRQCIRREGHTGEHKASKGTPLRNIRVPDPLWADAGKVARKIGYTGVSAYLIDALEMLVADKAIPWDLRE